MQWNRENAHNVLQVRSAVYSNEWKKYQPLIDSPYAKIANWGEML